MQSVADYQNMLEIMTKIDEAYPDLKMDDNAMRDTVDSDNNLAQSIVVEPAQKVGNLIDLDFSDSQINYPDQEIK